MDKSKSLTLDKVNRYFDISRLLNRVDILKTRSRSTIIPLSNSKKRKYVAHICNFHLELGIYYILEENE